MKRLAPPSRRATLTTTSPSKLRSWAPADEDILEATLNVGAHLAGWHLLKVMRVIKEIQSLNRVLKWTAGKRIRIAKEWSRELVPAVGLQRAKEEQRVLCIIRLMPGPGRRRRFDPDNLAGGAKFLVDALRITGWIHQDSPGWIKAAYHQEPIEAGQPGALVHVWRPLPRN